MFSLPWQTVSLFPGASAGEGVAVPPSVMAATHGEPRLGVHFSPEGKVGEGAEMTAIGVEKLRRSEGTIISSSNTSSSH